MPETKKFQIIKGIPIFSSLTEKELKEIESLFAEEVVKKDEYIFWEGDPSNWLYVVSEGKVRVLKQSASGKDIILEIISSGDLFGGVAVLDKRPYPASAQAMENSKILKLSRSNILKILDSYPTVAIDIVTYMGKRLRDAHEMMRSLAAERVEKRIATILLRLAEKIGIEETGGTRLDINLTRLDLAEMAGTTVETAIRVMSKFGKEGLVDSHAKKIVITNKEKLQSLLENK
ncbi:MAG: Crp/Fnr family transcriptional regulator [Nitrospirota bacterium]